MSTIVKDKNLVVFTIDGCKGHYTLDINTGIFYGLRGKPVKTCIKRKEIFTIIDKSESFRAERPNLRRALLGTFDDFSDTIEDPQLSTVLQCADKLDSLHCSQLIFWTDYAYLSDKIKMFMQYCQGKGNISISDFRKWYDLEQGKRKYGNILSGFTEEMYHQLMLKLRDITEQEMSVCAYYLIKGKYWEYHEKNLSNLVKYIKYCRYTDKAPIKTSNFMREYCETKQLYQLRQTEFDNIRIAKSYANQAKAWQFEYGDFTVVIPTSGQDIVTEGEKMHHCVGRYVGRVVDNEEYICFVRHKNDIETPYITCQVFMNGRIGQYYLAYDKKISSAEDKAFYNAFQQYLYEVWIDQD